MIEDKEHGIKVAEDKEEVFWKQIKDKIEKDVHDSKLSIELNEHILPFLEKKLKNWDTE